MTEPGRECYFLTFKFWNYELEKIASDWILDLRLDGLVGRGRAGRMLVPSPIYDFKTKFRFALCRVYL